jgi:hypothetical protein
MVHQLQKMRQALGLSGRRDLPCRPPRAGRHVPIHRLSTIDGVGQDRFAPGPDRSDEARPRPGLRRLPVFGASISCWQGMCQPDRRPGPEDRKLMAVRNWDRRGERTRSERGGSATSPMCLTACQGRQFVRTHARDHLVPTPWCERGTQRSVGYHHPRRQAPSVRPGPSVVRAWRSKPSNDTLATWRIRSWAIVST